MNELRVITRPTANPKVFDTYWMTGLIQKGRVRTTVAIHDDSQIAAELSALQYLLEIKNACGHDKSGAGLCLWVTFGAIPKLLRAGSDKAYLAPYANFLRTRFAGARIVVENRKMSWADDLCEQQVDELVVDTPIQTIIDVAEMGAVELTAHAVERYIERFERPAVKAWRDLVKLCKNAKPVVPKRRNPASDINHRERGRHLIADEVVLVIAEPSQPGRLPRLVSVLTNKERGFAALRGSNA